MRPNEALMTIEANLPGEKREMSMDPRAIAHLASVLSGLYSDQVLAVVREYSTNAMDSHILAGVREPIEVFTPTRTVRNLVIVDHGIGMSKDDLFDTYSMYGASTKRESEDLNGMLGLGSKSALALVSQFTITAVKDGIETIVLVAKNARGIGELTVISEKLTDSGNGVTVSIPISDSDFYRCNDAVSSFFKYWPSGSVKINGTPNANNYIKVSDDYLLDVSQASWGRGRIVMGGVCYTATSDVYDNNLSPKGIPLSKVIAYVDINGENGVEFSPSRESLLAHDHNRLACKRIFGSDLDDAMAAWVQAEMDAAITKPEQVRAYLRLANTLGNNYMQKAFPQHAATQKMFDDGFDKDAESFTAEVYTTVGVRPFYGVTPSGFMQDGVYIVTGCPKTRQQFASMRTVKRKLQAHGGSTYYMPLAGSKINHTDWIPDGRIITWEDILAVPVEPIKRNSSPSKRTGKGKLFVWDGSEFDEVEIDEVIGLSVFTIRAQRENHSSYGSDYYNTITDHLSAKIIKVYARDEAKVEKYFLSAKKIDEARALMAEKYATLAKTDMGKSVLRASEMKVFTLNKVTAEMINDPVIKSTLESMKTPEFLKMKSTLDQLERWATSVPDADDGALDNYPLLRYLDSWSTNGSKKGRYIAQYVNAIHESNNKEKK